jgi:hypothetical protein
MLNFRQALLKFAAPRLRVLGYEYSDALRDRSVVYGFHKRIGNDIQTIILFQRHQYEEHASGYDFTVELIRCKTDTIEQWHQGWYEGALRVRLGSVLLFVYGLQIPHYDYWWNPANTEQLGETFQDVLDKLERYGIPWLEDPESQDPWKLSATQRSEFREALSQFVTPELEFLGYEMIEETIGSLQSYYMKKLWENLNAFVIFQPGKQRPDSLRLAFDVLLCRKGSKNPLDPAWMSHEDWLDIRLGELLWEVYDLRIYSSEFVQWEYIRQEELGARLKDALDKVKRYAVPWLEDPETRNPRLVPAS